MQDGNTIYEPPRAVSLTQDKTIYHFPVTVSRFVPDDEDALNFSWTDSDGIEQTFEMPPYHISDMSVARENILQFFVEARDGYPRVLTADANPIVKRTFEEAQRYCQETDVSDTCQYLLNVPDHLRRTLSSIARSTFGQRLA